MAQDKINELRNRLAVERNPVMHALLENQLVNMELRGTCNKLIALIESRTPAPAQGRMERSS